MWTRERLTGLLAQLRLRGGASATVEVAPSRPGTTHDLPRTLCAFANTRGGGTIVLGVDAQEGVAVTGVADPATVGAGVIAQASTAVEPPVPVTVHTVDVDGAAVVVVDVPGLAHGAGPAVTAGVAYVRDTGGDRPMTGHELRMAGTAATGAGERFRSDARPVAGTSLEDLDGALTSAFLNRVRSENPRLSGVDDDERLLRLLRVTTGAGELTVAGLYALGFYPQGPEPGLGVTLATEERQVRIEGPLPVLLQESVEWMVARLRERGPGEAAPSLVTELGAALASALVHRDLGAEALGAGADVQVRLDAATLQISGPGGWERGGTNPRLQSLARYVRTSSDDRLLPDDVNLDGLRSAARKAGLPDPELVDVGVGATLTLWLNTAEMPVSSPQIESTETKVSDGLELVSLGKNAPLVGRAVEASGTAGVTLSELSEQTSLSNGQVRYALKALLGAGAVEMDGRQGDRSTVYRWLR